MTYNNDACNQFVADMEAAGHEVEHYHGRWHWTGPAIRCKRIELEEVRESTEVRLQSDTLGKDGLIVYPVQRGQLVD